MAIDFSPSGNVGSQVERAVIAHLKWFLQQAGLPAIEFRFGNDGRDRPDELIEVVSMKSTESPTHTRNEICEVRIELVWPGRDDPNTQSGNWNWIKINQYIGTIMAAMSVSDNAGNDYAATCALLNKWGSALAVDASGGLNPTQVAIAKDNADMANFTAQYLRYRGAARAGVSGGAIVYREIRNFEIDACSANVD